MKIIGRKDGKFILGLADQLPDKGNNTGFNSGIYFEHIPESQKEEEIYNRLVKILGGSGSMLGDKSYYLSNSSDTKDRFFKKVSNRVFFEPNNYKKMKEILKEDDGFIDKFRKLQRLMPETKFSISNQFVRTTNTKVNDEIRPHLIFDIRFDISDNNFITLEHELSDDENFDNYVEFFRGRDIFTICAEFSIPYKNKDKRILKLEFENIIKANMDFVEKCNKLDEFINMYIENGKIKWSVMESENLNLHTSKRWRNHSEKMKGSEIEERKALALLNESGGERGGSIMTRVTIPAEWAREMRINKFNRDLLLRFDGDKVVVSNDKSRVLRLEELAKLLKDRFNQELNKDNFKEDSDTADEFLRKEAFKLLSEKLDNNEAKSTVDELVFYTKNEISEQREIQRMVNYTYKNVDKSIKEMLLTLYGERSSLNKTMLNIDFLLDHVDIDELTECVFNKVEHYGTMQSIVSGSGEVYRVIRSINKDLVELDRGDECLKIPTLSKLLIKLNVYSIIESDKYKEADLARDLDILKSFNSEIERLNHIKDKTTKAIFDMLY